MNIRLAIILLAVLAVVVYLNREKVNAFIDAFKPNSDESEQQQQPEAFRMVS